MRGDEPRMIVQSLAVGKVYPTCVGMNRPGRIPGANHYDVYPTCVGMNRIGLYAPEVRDHVYPTCVGMNRTANIHI